jgi:hypothetical protein
MSRATPEMRDLARRLVLHEAKVNKSARVKNPHPFQVCEKLRPYLSTLMGDAGFGALFARSLSLAAAEIPWLRSVQVKKDGSLEGLDKLEARIDLDAVFEGSVVLVAQLLRLLTAFVGENLTLQIVREVWPKLSLKDLNFSKGDNHGKTK